MMKKYGRLGDAESAYKRYRKSRNTLKNIYSSIGWVARIIIFIFAIFILLTFIALFRYFTMKKWVLIAFYVGMICVVVFCAKQTSLLQ